MTVSGVDAVLGALFGLAYGDALGAPEEFRSYAEIIREHELPGPRDLPVRQGADGPVALVTDDTQMTLAVAGALLDALAAGGPLRAATFEAPLRERFVAWLRDPENNRAPGTTCLSACAGLERGEPWVRATVRGSKGCGANMRVLPLALAGLDEETRCGAAQLQAALTHGHPTALAASDLTVAAVHGLLHAVAPKDLPGYLREHAHARRSAYPGDWLGDELWRGPFADSPEAFAARGWDEVLAVLDRLDEAVAAADRRSDPCLATGEGWVAEEAIGTALLCFLLYPGDPVLAIARGAATSGDSDSIACLAGALAGVTHGVGAWPAHWRPVIEYGDELTRVAGALALAGSR